MMSFVGATGYGVRGGVIKQGAQSNGAFVSADVPSPPQGRSEAKTVACWVENQVHMSSDSLYGWFLNAGN